MTLAVTGILDIDTMIQYIHTQVRCESLCKYESFPAKMDSTETLNMKYIIKGLALYFPTINPLEQNYTMLCGMKTSRSINKTLCGALD